MDKLFKILKKGLVATIFVVFAFVFTYVPIPHQDNIKPAEAAVATIANQLIDNIQQLANFVQLQATALSAAALEFKEYVLDGAAWVIAKSLVNAMVSSMTAWIRSGFDGSPRFVEDIQGFLLETADVAFGEYISELGYSSFLCDPFKLDIQIALRLKYDKSRDDGRYKNDCTLTGIIDNIEGFMSGAQGSFQEGGWNDWFDITSQPETYTPYGSLLNAESIATARIATARGKEAAYLEFGNGFLSSKNCRDVEVGGGGFTKEICNIVLPGKTIVTALSDNIDTGRESLITADEIDELVAELIGALAQQLFTATGSLLSDPANR